MEPSTVGSLLAKAEVRLAACAIESPRLDSEVLLAHVLGVDRGRLAMMLAQQGGAQPGGAPVDDEQAASFRRLVKRRALREPLAYLTGVKEFWSLDFEVTPAVLIPRPETEFLVSRALALLGAGTRPRIVEVGTGSGAIAVVLAVERPDALIVATEISEAALQLARRNVARHHAGSRVALVRADLLSGLAGPFDMVISNPPYVSQEERATLMPEVREHEPAIALYAGHGGMEVYERLVPAAAGVLSPGGWHLMEIASARADETTGLLRDTGIWQDVAMREDYQGLPRVVCARRAEE